MTQRAILVLALILGCPTAGMAMADASSSWTLIAGADTAGDEAGKLAIADLCESAAGKGLRIIPGPDSAWPGGNVLLVGRASGNAQLQALGKTGALNLPAAVDEQGYTIQTIEKDGARVIAVTGGSVIGDVYGLYWVRDRVRVTGTLPDINTTRVPALKVRVAAAWGRHGLGGSNQEQMHQALRQSLNWVSGPNALDLVPWNAEPEATRNAETRDKTRELIAYAHALHMKYFSFSNEFTFHPSILEEFGATLSPCDPKFWDAVQGKYRKLFTALPELDGVELCNDDLSGFWDNYRAYDLLHENPECEWSYPKRFRTFVEKVDDVVAGEFNKTYFHFTWGLRADEQHYQPEVFRQIFTDAVPTKNLYLMPKITAADRWWHQPYNGTFNQTPHDTVVCFETMNYYESGKTNLFPTFSGQYFQRGLQTILMPEHSNVKGAACLAPSDEDDWSTTAAYAYVLYRLMWDPNDDMEGIARDFCAIHFGPEAAEGMAKIYLATPSAYKYGLHIEPVSYGQFNSFIHMRVGTFPVEGYPTIDGGREHLEFLRRIYLRCKPWESETLDDLDHGLAVAESMRAQYEDVKPKIADTAVADDIGRRLDMTRLLIATNNTYVRLIFAYFDYMDRPDAAGRNALQQACAKLDDTRNAFIHAPGYGYQLFGVDQLLVNARAALDDVNAARDALEKAPTREQLEKTVADQQRRYAEVLAQQADQAVRFAHVEAQIDGRDILNISGSEYQIEHIRWDPPGVKECAITVPLPRREVTVVVKDLYSRPLHPFILEQPNAENGYTVRIYLDDLPGGTDWMKFDIYYIDRPPGELGLALPWAK